MFGGRLCPDMDDPSAATNSKNPRAQLTIPRYPPVPLAIEESIVEFQVKEAH